jgi:hypothetical protein
MVPKKVDVDQSPGSATNRNPHISNRELKGAMTETIMQMRMHFDRKADITKHQLLMAMRKKSIRYIFLNTKLIETYCFLRLDQKLTSEFRQSACP